jgi:cysteine desulfurase/selenocysteine lyase
MKNIEKIRADFGILDRGGKKPLVYLDNACMSLRPDSVVAAMDEYYREYNACAGRSAHNLAQEVTKKVEEVRKAVTKFIGAKSEEEIIFTRNTTESINLLANSFGFKKGDKVLITDKEHNSNLVPWLYLRDKIGIEVSALKSNEDNSFNLESYKEKIEGVKMVSFVHTSNLDGSSVPTKEVVKIAHENGALVHLDAAQAMVHTKVDVRDLDVDFLSFSGHKMLGPTGTGVFYAKKDLLEKLDAFLVGGDTVENTTYDSYEFLPMGEKFEAGLQDFAGIIGLGEAVKYMSQLDYNEIQKHELELNAYLTEELTKFSEVKIIGPAGPAKRSGIVNLYIEGKDMHEMALTLDSMAGIAVRSGRHCVHSWFNDKKVYNSLRVSLAFYNTRKEAEIFVENFKKVMEII